MPSSLPLETERIFFRRWTPDDSQSLKSIFCDPETNALVGNGKPLDEAAVAGALEFFLQQYRENGFGPWAVVSKERSEIIGLSGLKRMPHLKHVDFGFSFIRSFWGQGFATEAGLKVIEFAFRGLGLETLSAVVRPDNLRSIAVLRKLRMKPSGSIQHHGIEQVLYLLERPGDFS